VRPLVKRICTQLVQIEMTPGGTTQPLQLVDSLNVSVATGILLHHMLSSAKQQP
jgi:tRNA G18 (ribose-2'-O)-methylase SpoU